MSDEVMQLEEMREKLEDRNLSKVGKEIGYTRAYLAAVRAGSKIPSYGFMVQLSKYLKNK
jgi:hypothetical protein